LRFGWIVKLLKVGALVSDAGSAIIRFWKMSPKKIKDSLNKERYWLSDRI
jgi:hypothetical protein